MHNLETHGISKRPSFIKVNPVLFRETESDVEGSLFHGYYIIILVQNSAGTVQRSGGSLNFLLHGLFTVRVAMEEKTRTPRY